MPVHPPNWYSLRQKVALGQGMDRKEYDSIVAEGRKNFPDFAAIVTNKFYFLLPRWYGQEGEAEKYLAEKQDWLEVAIAIEIDDLS